MCINKADFIHCALIGYCLNLDLLHKHTLFFHFYHTFTPLNTRFKIFSYCLLFAYSLALIDTIIPHHHKHADKDILAWYEKTNYHKHHNPVEEKTSEHRHFEHAGHFDAGAFDVLICLLSELEHSSTNGHHSYYTYTFLRTDLSYKYSKSQQPANLLPSSDFKINKVLNTYFSYKPTVFYYSPSKYTSLRAPPFFC